MAKKFGKFLLFTAAVGTAAAAAYYYMQQKDSQLKESSDADDDYDDFHEDLDKSTEFSRNYVPLNTPVQTSAPKEETAQSPHRLPKRRHPLPQRHLISHRSPIRLPDYPAKRARPSKTWKSSSMKKMPRTKSLP